MINREQIGIISPQRDIRFTTQSMICCFWTFFRPTLSYSGTPPDSRCFCYTTDATFNLGDFYLPVLLFHAMDFASGRKKCCTPSVCPSVTYSRGSKVLEIGNRITLYSLRVKSKAKANVKWKCFVFVTLANSVTFTYLSLTLYWKVQTW